MTVRGRLRAESSSRWLAYGLVLYFVLTWVSLADRYRLAGGLLVLVLGLFWSAWVFRRRQDSSPKHGSMDSSSDENGLGQPVEPVESDSSRVIQPGPSLSDRSRARFLSALGHELRNPLNSVTGFSDMLLGGIDGTLNSEQERSVRTIRASAERLLRLVSTIVDEAKLEAGTLRLHQQWVAPDDLIAEAIGFVRSRIDGGSVVSVATESLPRVFVDRQRTVQALVSLAVLVMRSSATDLAFRARPPRREQVGNGFVQFDLITSIEDSAAGELAVVERLREPLSVADALALEVAVARRIIEAQGGRIWTEAGTAGSLRICMTLPTSSA